MRLVIIESPFSPSNGHPAEKNKAYALAAVLDCLERGESPIASHLLFTQVLDDQVQWEREMGIDAGLAWYGVAEACVIYRDLGISRGMKQGIEKALHNAVPLEYRTIPDFKWKAPIEVAVEEVNAAAEGLLAACVTTLSKSVDRLEKEERNLNVEAQEG